MAHKSRLIVLLFVCVAVAAMTQGLFSFVFIQPEVRWPAGQITMEMQLGQLHPNAGSIKPILG